MNDDNKEQKSNILYGNFRKADASFDANIPDNANLHSNPIQKNFIKFLKNKLTMTNKSKSHFSFEDLFR